MHRTSRIGFCCRALALPAALILSGCPATDETTTEPVSSSSLQEEAASASHTLGLLLEAATEASLGAMSLPAARSNLHEPRVLEPHENVPDVTQLPGLYSVDLATIRANGKPLFTAVTIAGNMTLTHVGTAVPSSPMGTTTLYNGTVSVALNGIVITNGNGDVLRIPSGTFSYTVAAQTTTTDATNWTYEQRVATAIDPAISATVLHAGRTLTLTMGGNRTMRQLITRENGPTINRRTVTRDISGTADGHALSTDSVIGGHLYAEWRVSVQGNSVVWNRFASVTTVTDFTQPPGTPSTTTVSTDHTCVTVLGLVLGPKTAREWGSLLGTRLQAEFL